MKTDRQADRRSVRIDGLRRTVSDLRRSIDFYRGALGFEPLVRHAPPMENTVRMRLGEQHIDLVRGADPVPLPVDWPGASDPRFQHAAIVTRDMTTAWRRLEAHAAVAISRHGPQVLPAHTGGVTAFKFRDPDGHPLELIEFPVGTGDPHWQTDPAGGPTLGIDHFALVVGDVDRSVAFCADRLGLRVAGRDINRGVEQDRLDGLDGVEVDVVSLEPRRGPRTPHLELLHYRHPVLARSADGQPVAFEPDEIVCLADPHPLAEARALRLCDPDGHRFVTDLSRSTTLRSGEG